MEPVTKGPSQRVIVIHPSEADDFVKACNEHGERVLSLAYTPGGYLLALVEKGST